MVFAVAVGFGGALALNASAATQPAMSSVVPATAIAAQGVSGEALSGLHGEHGVGEHGSPATRTLEGSSKAVLLRANPVLRRGDDDIASDD